MVEVTDNLEGSFEAIEREHVEAEALRAEVAALTARVAASERPGRARELLGAAGASGGTNRDGCAGSHGRGRG